MADVEQDGSSRSSSRGSSFSLCHMTESAYAKVVFCEIHDSYSMDTDVECLYQLSESVVPHPDDYIGLFRVGMHDLEECITSVPCASSSTNASLAGESYNKIVFKVNDLPKDNSEYYQFLYLTGDHEICGASTPFKFHNVHEDENVVVLSAEHDFLEVKSSSSLLHNRLAEAQKQIAVLEKAKKQLEAKIDVIQKENDEVKINLEEVKLAHNEFEMKLTSCLASVVEEKELPECSESLQTMICSLKAQFNSLSKSNTALKTKNSEIEEANSVRKVEFETKLISCLTSIVEAHPVLPELPECSENLQTLIYSSKAQVNRLSRANKVLHLKNTELERTLTQVKGDLDSYKAKELQTAMQNTAVTDSVRTSLQKLKRENAELKEERSSLQKALSDAKDLFHASEECKSLVHHELENAKKCKDEMAANMEDLKLLNTLLKKQLANNESAIKDMEKVWKEMEEVKGNHDTEKDTWDKQRSELEDKISVLTVRDKKCSELEGKVRDLTIRLGDAAQLYKKQYLEIRNLKKQLKSHESSKRMPANGGVDPSEERHRSSSCDSGTSLEGAQTPSFMDQSVTSLNDSHKIMEYIGTTEEKKQGEAVPDSRPANLSTNYLSWSTCSSAADIIVGKPSAPSEEEMSSHGAASTALAANSTAPASISFAALRELMIVDGANSNKASTRSFEAADSTPASVCTNETSTFEHVNGLPEVATEMFDIPCPTCEKMIKVYSHNTSMMEEHLLKVHNQQLCPVCGSVFDEGLPSNYFKYHVDNHFIVAQHSN